MFTRNTLMRLCDPFATRHRTASRDPRARIESIERRVLFAAGDLDPSFGGGDGFVASDFGRTNELAADVVVQSDGKIVAVGHAWDEQNIRGNVLITRSVAIVARYNASGTPDTSFGGGDGVVEIDFGAPGKETANAVALASGGKIVVAGTGLARLNANGSFDTSFGGGDGIIRASDDFEPAVGLAIQSDGKIAVVSETNVTRYTTSGARDTTFGSGGRASAVPAGVESFTASDLAVQDGRLVVAASIFDAPDTGSERDFAVVRLTSAGSIDTTFGEGDGFVAVNEELQDRTGGIAVGPGGAIAVAGNDADEDVYVISMGRDGSRVGLRSDLVPLRPALATDVAFAPDGGIFVTGMQRWENDRWEDVFVARFTPDHVLDTRFNGTGYAVKDLGGHEWGFGMTVDGAGRVVVAGLQNGTGSPGQFLVARFLTASSPDGIELNDEGELIVHGTSSPDTIAFSSSGTNVVVSVNGTTRTFPRSQVQSVLARALGGNDTITVGDNFLGPADTNQPRVMIFGGDGNNTFRGGSGAEYFLGGNGDDYMDGGRGGDWYLGGLGTDTVDYSSRTASVRVNAGDIRDDDDGEEGERDRLQSGIERILGGSGNDVLTSSDFDQPNALFGNGGNDVLDGGTGQDSLFGGAGDDRLEAGEIPDRFGPRYSADFFSGGSGRDLIDYSERPHAVAVSLDNVANDGTIDWGVPGEGDNVGDDIEGVLGTNFDDVLVGSARSDMLSGGGGNDTIRGLGGSDLLFDVAGNDTLSGGDGDDTLADPQGTNTLDGGPGNDAINSERENPGADVVLQAEDAVLVGPQPLRTHAGYTGSGYADYTNASGDYIEWLASPGRSGDYVLTFRYANGSALSRPLELRIDNQLVRSRLEFPSTGGWNVWRTVSVTAPLPAQHGLVRLTSVGANGGNIDSLSLRPALSGPQPYQAENAALFGARRSSSHAGYSGSGYADYANSTGDWIEFVVQAAQAGTRTATFRYANGAASARPLELQVNGAVVNPRLSFGPTGSWSTWREVTAQVQLVAGANRIRLTSIGFNGPNIDSMTVSA
jgi:uncharacterized delta-60 repeat protein